MTGKSLLMAAGAATLSLLPQTTAAGCQRLTAGENMAGLLVAAETNVGHDNAASLELPPHPRVNTLWPPP